MTDTPDTDLADLQERFPTGSRWKTTTPLGSCTVIGIDMDRAEPHVVIRYGPTDYRAVTVRAVQDWDWVRIPDLPPCPVNEPLTLGSYQSSLDGAVAWTSAQTHPAAKSDKKITLLPPGERPSGDVAWAGWWYS